MQLLDQFRSRLISQLIKDILRVLQNLLRFFNYTIISTTFAPLSPVLPVISSFILNESVIPLASVKSVIALLAFKAGSPLQYCYNFPDAFE